VNGVKGFEDTTVLVDGEGGEEDGQQRSLGVVAEGNQIGQQVLGTCSPVRWPNLKAALRDFFHPEPWDPPVKDETTPAGIAAWIAKRRHPASCDGTDNCGCAS
jgi:hypothetical protein